MGVKMRFIDVCSAVANDNWLYKVSCFELNIDTSAPKQPMNPVKPVNPATLATTIC